MRIHPVVVFLRLVVVVVFTTGSVLSSHAAGKVASWGDNYYGPMIMPNGLKNIRAVAAGSAHSLALKSDGTVVTWGWNIYGVTNYGVTTPPPALNNVVSIAAGGYVSMALRANGTVVVWGNNSWGQINVPTDLARVVGIATGGAHCLALKADGTVTVWASVPGTYSNTNFPPGLSGVTAVAAGAFHSVALIADGTVVSWGNNSYGQTNVPAGLSNVVAIAAADRHSLALKADGTVAAWGYDTAGQTNVPGGLTDVVAIAAGDYVNLALRADGTLASWGSDDYAVTNLPPGISNVTGIACGSMHSLALVSEGPPEIISAPTDTGVFYQSNIVLNVAASGYEPVGYQWYFNGAPLTDSARVSGVTTTTLALANAQFSDIGKYSLVASNAFGAVRSADALLTVISPPIITQQPVGQTVIAGTNITLTGAAIGTPPLGYQWLLDVAPVNGATSNSLSLTNIQSSQSGNYTLQVGNDYGTNETSIAPVTVLESPPYILTQPTNIAAFLGGAATFAVNARGSTPMMYQWRFNGVDISGATNSTLTLTALRYDQAGLYTVAVSNAFGSLVSAKVELTVQQVAVWGSVFRFVPPDVPSSFSNLVALTAGDGHLLALKADGNMAVWPAPTLGAVDRNWSLTNIPPSASNVIAIAAGAQHNLALKSNGTIVAWGVSMTVWSPPSIINPTNVPAGLSNVVAIASGSYHNVALKADGQVISWGAYQPNPPIGALYASATNVPAGLSNIIAIAAGGAQNLALKADGTVRAWGNATNVPIGLSNVIAIACTEDLSLALHANGKVTAWATTSTSIPPLPRPRPFPVATNVPPGLSNVVAIAAGVSGEFGLALKTDGVMATWGYNGYAIPTGLSNVFAITAGLKFVAALVGDGSPHFTIQPASQTATNGMRVEFHARAAGVQPLSYQWQHDGANLVGATTPDLIITNAGGGNTGNYRIVATNSLGTITSSVATLTIPFSTNLASALNATNLVWTTTPTNEPWFAQIRETHDGDVAAQSGHIGNNQQSLLEAAVVGPGTLTFWWKISSEQGYDRLWFNMDYQNWATWISGETDWQQFTFPVPPGSHILTWAYTKDTTVTAAQDAAWLDEVTFTPAGPLTLSAPRQLADGSFSFWSADTGGRQLLPLNLARIEVQASTNLHDWVALPGVYTLTNGSLLIRDPYCTNFPHRFYRVIEH